MDCHIFFVGTLCEKFAIKLPLKISPHLKGVDTTLWNTNAVFYVLSHNVAAELAESLRMTQTNCGKRIKLSFVDLKSRIDDYSVAYR